MTFRYPMTVPYYQVDQQGVVFNMWYLAWCDDAMAAWFEWLAGERGVDIDESFDVHLVHSEIDWIEPARWRDAVEITVAGTRVGTTSFDVGFEVHRGDEVLARVTTVYVSIDPSTGSKTPVSDQLRAALAD